MYRGVPRCFTAIVFDVLRKHLQRVPPGGGMMILSIDIKYISYNRIWFSRPTNLS